MLPVLVLSPVRERRWWHKNVPSCKWAASAGSSEACSPSGWVNHSWTEQKKCCHQASPMLSGKGHQALVALTEPQRPCSQVRKEAMWKYSTNDRHERMLSWESMREEAYGWERPWEVWLFGVSINTSLRSKKCSATSLKAFETYINCIPSALYWGWIKGIIATLFAAGKGSEHKHSFQRDHCSLC